MQLVKFVLVGLGLLGATGAASGAGYAGLGLNDDVRKQTSVRDGSTVLVAGRPYVGRGVHGGK